MFLRSKRAFEARALGPASHGLNPELRSFLHNLVLGYKCTCDVRHEILGVQGQISLFLLGHFKPLSSSSCNALSVAVASNIRYLSPVADAINLA